MEAREFEDFDKGRYALRVMIDLAEQNSDEYIPLKAIAKKQEISEKYLESIIVVLSKAGFSGRNARQRAAVINWRALRKAIRWAAFCA